MGGATTQARVVAAKVCTAVALSICLWPPLAAPPSSLLPPPTCSRRCFFNYSGLQMPRPLPSAARSPTHFPALRRPIESPLKSPDQKIINYFNFSLQIPCNLNASPANGEGVARHALPPPSPSMCVSALWPKC